MARARLGYGDFVIAILRQSGHLLCPVLPVAVLNSQGDRRADGFAPADTGTNLSFVFLDQHAAAPAVALLAPPQVVIDLANLDRKARRHAVDDHRQTRAV